MKRGTSIFFGALVALGASWCGFVLAPVLQLAGAKQTTVLNSPDLYPVNRPGQANQGLQVYRANGCAACHTEQVRQEGAACEVVLTDPGKNPVAVTNLTAHLKLTNLNKEAADAVVQSITTAGGKAEVHISAVGADIARGWGFRHSVAADYLYDSPVQLGNLRAGPDLANVGMRAPDVNWQLRHLYAPQSVVDGSTMPPFRYLFELRKIGRTASPDALPLPLRYAPPPGYEVVPTDDAKALAAYLVSLRVTAALYEAPYTAAVAAKP